jgi:hypothetical protein
VGEYKALEETAEILSDRKTLEAIDEGLAEIERGEVVPLEQLRAELAELRKKASGLERQSFAFSGKRCGSSIESTERSTSSLGQ